MRAEKTRQASTPPNSFRTTSDASSAPTAQEAPQRFDEGEPLGPDVDADDLVAEGRRDLDRIMPEPAGGADHGDRGVRAGRGASGAS